MNDPIRREPGATDARAATGRRGGRARWRWRAAVRTLQLALTVFVTWLILERLGPGVEELASGGQLLVVRWGWLAASCAALAAGYGASGWIWGRMVRDLGGPALPAREAVRIYLVANLGRYVPGKLWQIAGLALLARARGVSAPVATGAAVMGQALALAGATLIGLPALSVAGPAADGREGWLVAIAAVVIAGVGVPRVFRPMIRFWLRRVPGDAPLDITASAFGGLRWLIFYTLNWAGYALAFWLLMRGLSLPGGVLVVGPAFAAAYVLGYLMLFAPAGLGVREGFLVAFLSPTMGPGGAALAAIAARVWTTTIEVVPAGAFWLAGFARSADRTGREGEA